MHLQEVGLVVFEQNLNCSFVKQTIPSSTNVSKVSSKELSFDRLHPFMEMKLHSAQFGYKRIRSVTRFCNKIL